MVGLELFSELVCNYDLNWFMGGRDKEDSLGVGVVPVREYFDELEFFGTVIRYKT